MKLKLKQAYPKPNNTSVVVYYSKDKQEMKYPTGVSIGKEKDKSGKYKDWDYKLNMIKPYVKDFETKKTKIEAIVSKANRILSLKYEQGIVPSKMELEILLTQDEVIKNRTINSVITELFDSFYTMKSEYFKAKGSIKSLTDYNATRNLLLDFEVEKEKKFIIGEIDYLWFMALLNFARTKRLESKNEYKFKTKGALVDKTADKRFSILTQFFEFLKEQKIVNQELIDTIKKFRKKEIKVVRTDKETLTIGEVHAFYDFIFEHKRHEQVRDVFVFCCFTGIRFTDIKEFDSRFIISNSTGEGKVYKKKANKTLKSSGASYEIPLCDTVLDILAKYDNSLPVISNQKSNDYLTEALKLTKLFDGVTEQIDKETNQYKKRYEAITMHKGRDTFITNLVDSTPLNELMKYTGHTQISTLQQYIDRNRPISMNYITIFNR